MGHNISALRMQGLVASRVIVMPVGIDQCADWALYAQLIEQAQQCRGVFSGAAVDKGKPLGAFVEQNVATSSSDQHDLVINMPKVEIGGGSETWPWPIETRQYRCGCKPL